MRLHLDRMWIKHTTQRPREHKNSAPGAQKRTLLEHIDSKLADLLNIAFCISGVASVLQHTWRCFQTQANSSTEAISQTGATRAHVLRLFLATRLLNLPDTPPLQSKPPTASALAPACCVASTTLAPRSLAHRPRNHPVPLTELLPDKGRHPRRLSCQPIHLKRTMPAVPL